MDRFPIDRTARTTLGPPKTEQSIFRTLRDNALRRGELVPVSQIRTWASRFLINARDTLLAGPSELQDVLAAETDPLKVNAMLRAWLERVMAKFHQLERLWGADCEDRSSTL